MNINIRFVTSIIAIAMIAIGCSPSKATISGKLIALGEADTLSNRQIVLCQLTGDMSNLPTDCTLMDSTVTSNKEGDFQIINIPKGKYFVLYDTGLSDFKSGLDKWKGKTLKLSDIEWVLGDYCGTSLDKVTVHVMPGMSLMTNSLKVAVRDLYACNSPFVLALDPTKDDNIPLVVDTDEDTSEIEIQVHNFENNQ